MNRSSIFFAIAFNLMAGSLAHAGALVCVDSSDPSNLSNISFSVEYPGGHQGKMVVEKSIENKKVNVDPIFFQVGEVHSNDSGNNVIGGYILFEPSLNFDSKEFMSIHWIENKMMEEMPATMVIRDKAGKFYVNSRGSCTSYQ